MKSLIKLEIKKQVDDAVELFENKNELIKAYAFGWFVIIIYLIIN